MTRVRAHTGALGERTDVPQMPVSANVSDDWTASQLRSVTYSEKSHARLTRSPSTRGGASVDSPAYGIGVIVRRWFRLHPSKVCHDSFGGFLFFASEMLPSHVSLSTSVNDL